MRKRKKRVKVLKPYQKALLIFYIIANIICGSFLIYYAVSPNKKIDNLLYTYNINQNLGYKVYLKDNEHIKDEYLGMNESYITDLVKYIDVDYEYNFKNSVADNIEYSYEITALLTATYQLEGETTKVWNKNYKLGKESKKLVNASSAKINKNLKISLGSYIKEAISFRNAYAISINPKLIITIKTILKTDNSVSPLTETDEAKITIPILQQVFKINTEYNPNKQDSKFTDPTIIEKDANLEFILGLCFIAFSIFGSIVLFSNNSYVANAHKFNIELDKILKKYGDIIIEINTRVDKYGKQVIKVKDFNEMVDLEEELRIPIDYYTIRKNCLGEFTIEHDHKIYSFMLDVDDL